ncbi:hypothetical protein HDF24_01045 [Mucilaginibacter sp. X4EP1]|uniref:hypothetical protein n=1 Tax=Mucilaginibacter sp. X4EP1 TaxID=2723092 RepID=UPI002169BF3E|nr:hypothetical protein [Mucilaginibacter sp. X4EP1]MCS3811601.1 hypothetical protein [Mucilaginibacter sp. X4EP1]
MERKKIAGIIDIITVDDAATIRALAADERVDRDFKFRPLYNGFILKRVLRALSYKGAHFPHMTTKEDAIRKEHHDSLWEQFNANVSAMANGPDELEPLAKWIRQETTEQEAGVLVQQIIGRFFSADFKATPDSWQAALILHEAAGSKNLPKMLWWRLTGKVQYAKKLLGVVTNDNLLAIHGIAVAAHNLVATAGRLKSFYADESLRKTLTPETAVEQSLSAPPVVYRQALADGAAAGCPYSKSTLFLLKLQDANRNHQAKDMIFMTGTWSRCPAEQWIPAVIAGTWKRAIGT